MSFTEKIAFWKSLPRDNPNDFAAANDYYEQDVLPLVAADFVERERKNLPPDGYSGLISTLGTSWPPLALSILALRPKELLLLATEATARLIEPLASFAGLEESQYKVRLVNASAPAPLYQAMAEACAAWRKAGYKKIALDITGGTKAMAAGAAMAGAMENLDIFYISSRFLPLYRCPEPGSERLEQIITPIAWRNGYSHTEGALI